MTNLSYKRFRRINIHTFITRYWSFKKLDLKIEYQNKDTISIHTIKEEFEVRK